MQILMDELKTTVGGQMVQWTEKKTDAYIAPAH